MDQETVDQLVAGVYKWLQESRTQDIFRRAALQKLARNISDPKSAWTEDVTRFLVAQGLQFEHDDLYRAVRIVNMRYPYVGAPAQEGAGGNDLIDNKAA